MTEQTGNNKPNEAEGLAFPLSGNEKLIEEARATMRRQEWAPAGLLIRLADALEAAEKAHTTTPPDGWFYMGSHVGATWLNLEFSEEMDETGLPLWERPVQHTPTDDEREAIATVIAKTWAEDDITPPTDYDFADAILHAGFHRTEPQGEPSDAGVDDAWWKAQEAGQLPRTPGPSIRQAFKAGYRAALRAAGGVR